LNSRFCPIPQSFRSVPWPASATLALLVWWLSIDADGNRKQQSETVRGTKKQAGDRLRERLSEIESGGYIVKNSQTVAQHLEHFMQTYAANNTTLRTQQDYRSYIWRYINPALGNMPLQKLTGQHIQTLHAGMLK
jgi:hypothetical protein